MGSTDASGRAEPDVMRVRELEQLPPALDDPSGRLGERLAAPGAHLDLRRDQLPDQVLLEPGAFRSSLELVEVWRERERLRVEERELLLDGEREVLTAVEGFASIRQELLPRRFTH